MGLALGARSHCDRVGRSAGESGGGHSARVSRVICLDAVRSVRRPVTDFSLGIRDSHVRSLCAWTWAVFGGQINLISSARRI